MEWFSALYVARNNKRLGKNQHKCLPISKSNKQQRKLNKTQKDFQGINSSKEDVGGRSHHI
jgi:hypothetical protein